MATHIVETNVSNLKINKLTQAQYAQAVQQGIIGDNELSIITDVVDGIVTVMPTPSASYEGTIVQFAGTTDANYTNGYFYKCVSDGASTPTYSWENIEVQPAGNNFQYDVIPAASAANKDHIVQYTGETTADYQNGYFYKCIEFDSAVDGAGTIILYNDDTEIPEGLTFSFNKNTFNTYAATLQTDEAKPLVSPYLVISLAMDEDGYPLLEVYYNGESEEYAEESESYLVSPADKTVEPWELPNGAQLNGLFASIGFTTNFTDELAEDFSSVQLTLQSVLAYNWINEFVQETFPDISEFKYTARDPLSLGAILKTDGSRIYWEKSLISRPKWNKNYLNHLCVTNVEPNGTFSLGWDEGTVRNRSYGYAGSLAIGDRNTTTAPGKYRTAIGMGTEVNAAQGLAIGYNATISSGAQYAILLGNAPQDQRISNGDAKTFKVYNGNGTYEIMSANGTIPEARLADMTNAAQGDVLTLDANGNAVWASPTKNPQTMPVLVGGVGQNAWDNKTQTLTVQGVTTTNSVFVAPAPASAVDYATAGVLCTSQGTNSLTFICTTVPSNDITVNVVIL